jgi:hypothetical protein
LVALDLMEEFRPVIVDAVGPTLLVDRDCSDRRVHHHAGRGLPDEPGLGIHGRVRAAHAHPVHPRAERQAGLLPRWHPRNRHPRGKLRDLIDPVEDQVRLYPLDDRAARQVAVIGARTIEERQDFWIIT